VLRFEDPEGQRLTLVDDGGAPFHGEIWDGADVPAEHAIRGFYATALTTHDLDYLGPILTQLLNMEEINRFTDENGDTVAVFAMDGGGPGKEVHVTEQAGTSVARLGVGGVHHVAFRVTDFEEQKTWHERLQSARVPVSQFIDRYYFRSIYFRISNGILFEIATDGPGFATDEPLETLGERLALPPFLESQREQIETNLKPIVAE
jgi:glyoxalase family protein